MTHYPRAKLTYLDIPNIHAVRDSYDSLRNLCLSGESSKWYSSLEGTQWLGYLSLIIKVGGVKHGICEWRSVRTYEQWGL